MEMGDYRKMYDSKYLANWDLDKDATVKIKSVVAGEVEGEKGEKTKCPLVYFAGAQKALVLNKTNGKTIAGMYGTDCDKWAGKSITLFATTCEAFGETKDCIRVRPGVPQEKVA